MNRLWMGPLAMSATMMFGADWGEATGRLTPGQRVEVQHKDRVDRGLYSLANANEIVITTGRNGFVSIPQAEVDRLIVQGTDSDKLGYFANARDQLLPKMEVVYERTGAPPPPRAKKKLHWWLRR